MIRLRQLIKEDHDPKIIAQQGNELLSKFNGNKAKAIEFAKRQGRISQELSDNDFWEDIGQWLHGGYPAQEVKETEYVPLRTKGEQQAHIEKLKAAVKKDPSDERAQAALYLALKAAEKEPLKEAKPDVGSQLNDIFETLNGVDNQLEDVYEKLPESIQPLLLARVIKPLRSVNAYLKAIVEKY